MTILTPSAIFKTWWRHWTRIPWNLTRFSLILKSSNTPIVILKEFLIDRGVNDLSTHRHRPLTSHTQSRLCFQRYSIRTREPCVLTSLTLRVSSAHSVTYLPILLHQSNGSQFTWHRLTRAKVHSPRYHSTEWVTNPWIGVKAVSTILEPRALAIGFTILDTVYETSFILFVVLLPFTWLFINGQMRFGHLD